MKNEPRVNRTQRLDAPEGRGPIDTIAAPWGGFETGYVHEMRSPSGAKEEYACVSRPRGNPFVHYSVFRRVGHYSVFRRDGDVFRELEA